MLEAAVLFVGEPARVSGKVAAVGVSYHESVVMKVKPLHTDVPRLVRVEAGNLDIR